MAKASYEQIKSLLTDRIEFKGNTMSATVENGMSAGFLNSSGRMYFKVDPFPSGLYNYVVWSYGTPIAAVDEDGNVVIPDNKFSVTTSRHQGLCRAYLK